MISKLKNINFKILFFKLITCSFILTFSFSAIISLYSHNQFDPSPFTVNDDIALNLLGGFGANLSAVLLVTYGDASWLLGVFTIFLARIIVIKKYNFFQIAIRLVGIILCIFMISISLSLIGLDAGILGKTLISKFMILIKTYQSYEKIILTLNLLIFSTFLIILISKRKASIFLALFEIVRFLIRSLISIYFFIFQKKEFIKKRTRYEKSLNNQDTKKARSKTTDFILPDLNFLDDITLSKNHKNENINLRAKSLKKVLDDYGVKGDILHAKEGPIVTRYELEPAPGTRSARIISLSDDIARSMSAKSTRVSVIYGKNAIGIELPNRNIDTVFLKEILSSDVFNKSKGLTLALGKDISGKPLVADLSKMPHLLVAGTTGSGKSVSINAMIISLLYRYTNDQCKFILIDPKMLELSVYEDIPHLLHPVVTDPRKAVFALKWAVKEMNERYKLMANLGVRNVESYNQIIVNKKFKDGKLIKKVQIGFDNTTGRPIYHNKEIQLNPLPFIVVVVDEMADLMLTAGKEIEVSIQSLAQKARAAGIHLILATQRPSVDVITGTIKANLPYRISFQVTSKIDSRTILGEQGAEQLLGRGDMLFMAGGGYTERVHGPFVSDQEILKVTNFIKSQGEPNYQHYITEGEDQETDNITEEELDPLFDKALNLIKKERKVSTSFLQRHFSIGYNRAARIVDVFERKGIVSSPNSMGRREVLIDA